jgi:GNAT superfamily N-acetyltransferase
VSIEATVREIGRDEWSAATPIAARAFFDEEFIVGMLGPDPLRRWADAHHFYAVEPFDDTAVHLGAFVGDVHVGIIRVSPYGTCFVCTHVDPTMPPDDEILAKDWRFEVEVLEAHQGHAGHAWISRVAVEPQLHGTGLGKLLVDAAVAHLEASGSGPVLLECLAQRETFYTGRGFRRAAEVVDVHADTSYLMLLDLPR